MNIEDRENKISLAEIELIYKYINHIYYTDKNIFKHITTNNNSIYNIKVYYDIDNNDIVINSMINKCKYTIANLHKYGINYDINIYNNINANDIKIIYNYISYLYKSNINNFKYIIYNDTTNNFYNIKIEYYNDNVDIDNKTILTHSINQPIQENLNTYYNKYKPNDIDSNIYIQTIPEHSEHSDNPEKLNNTTYINDTKITKHIENTNIATHIEHIENTNIAKHIENTNIPDKIDSNKYVSPQNNNPRNLPLILQELRKKFGLDKPYIIPTASVTNTNNTTNTTNTTTNTNTNTTTNTNNTNINIINNYTILEYRYYNKLDNNKKLKIEELENNINQYSNIEIPLRFKVLDSNLPLTAKRIIIHKLNEYQKDKLDLNPEAGKYRNLVNDLLQIPLEKYNNLTITKNSTTDEISNYLHNSRKILDNVVYGHNDTKDYILEIISKMIMNPESPSNIIALHGLPGTGKTSIIQQGIAKILNRPLVFVSLGGISSVSYFNGHSYTYEGSTYGKIAAALIESNCMNPIIYFDELDKIGDTPYSEEITNLLIHLTDNSQNFNFIDKYLSMLPLDISKCIFIFSFNNIEKINPILLDRLTIVNINDYTIEEKFIIGKDYLLPKILKDIGLEESKIILSDDNIKYIIHKYIENTSGMRALQKCLLKLFSRINYLLMIQDSNILSIQINNKIILNNNIIDDILKKTININLIDNMYNHMYI